MPAPACRHWLGSEHRRCGAADGLDQYLTGIRCPAHSPARIAGRPEPQPGPVLPRDRKETAA